MHVIPLALTPISRPDPKLLTLLAFVSDLDYAADAHRLHVFFPFVLTHIDYHCLLHPRS